MANIFIQTYGCTTNISESEVMAGLLTKAGHKIINQKEKADLIIINICSVKGPSLSNALKQIRKTKIRLIAAGCILKQTAAEIKKINLKAGLVSTHNIKEIVKAVNETLKGNKIKLLKEKKQIKICLPKIRKNSLISIIPISSGCNSQCSYCSVRLIKGRLFSYPQESIISEAKNSLSMGVKEIWITSQDTASYMLDKKKKSQLPKLLKKLIDLNADFKIRLGMMNPNNLMPIMNELIKIYKHKKMFKFLHVPVQSGSNEILKKMKRKYTVEQFKKIIKRFRRSVPDITISTDIICGFPGETEEQFNDSIELIKEIKPEILNISKYWPMPGTKASKSKQTPGRAIKQRSKEMTKVFTQVALEQNKAWKGWKGKALIDEKGKNNSWIGRNFAYRPIIVFSNKDLFGKEIEVKVKEVTIFDLRAEIS